MKGIFFRDRIQPGCLRAKVNSSVFKVFSPHLLTFEIESLVTSIWLGSSIIWGKVAPGWAMLRDHPEI